MSMPAAMRALTTAWIIKGFLGLGICPSVIQDQSIINDKGFYMQAGQAITLPCQHQLLEGGYDGVEDVLKIILQF